MFLVNILIFEVHYPNLLYFPCYRPLVPVSEVHMFSLPTGSIDSEAIEEYEDGQKVEMAAGQHYFFRCTAIGGNPAPQMTITLGDMDVS